MTSSHRTGRAAWVLCSWLVAASLVTRAQQPAPPPAQPKPFTPVVGQPGKDVVWVPSQEALVDKMLDMAHVTPQDFVIDLGSGDGRTVIAAAKRGARALGIEYDADLVELSKQKAAEEGVAQKATFLKADLFESDFSKASVLALFLMPEMLVRLTPKFLELAPGSRIVSNSFTMDDWDPDETATVETGCKGWCTAHLWIVPATAAGVWTLGAAELTLKQSFQRLSGTLASANRTMPITNGRIRGDQITFTAGGAQYAGRVSGNSASGTVTSDGKTVAWTATRK